MLFIWDQIIRTAKAKQKPVLLQGRAKHLATLQGAEPTRPTAVLSLMLSMVSPNTYMPYEDSK